MFPEEYKFSPRTWHLPSDLSELKRVLSTKRDSQSVARMTWDQLNKFRSSSSLKNKFTSFISYQLENTNKKTARGKRGEGRPILICKPQASSQGRGIKILTSPKDIPSQGR